MGIILCYKGFFSKTFGQYWKINTFGSQKLNQIRNHDRESTWFVLIDFHLNIYNHRYWMFVCIINKQTTGSGDSDALMFIFFI